MQDNGKTHNKINNLFDVFSTHFPEDTTRIAIHAVGDVGPSYRYTDLLQESARWANFLTHQGLKPGDRVSVHIDKCTQGLALYLGCLRAGFIYHPLNTAYQYNELDYFLGNAQPSAIIYSAAYREHFQKLAKVHRIQYQFLVDTEQTPNLENYSPEFKTVASNAADTAALLYSSGTTGRPKGIMLSHGNLATNAQALVNAWGFSDKDTLLHTLPIFHVHGLFVAIGCALMSGATMRYLPKFDVHIVLDQLPQSTVMMGVPTYYTRLLADNNINKDHCRKMRLFISGSAPLLEETFHQFQQRTGHTVLERYGMTETNMNTSNPLYGKRKAGSVGLPLPDVDLRIVKPDGTPLKAGEIGDLQVRGPNVFSGYWHMPEKTQEDFTEDGFFNTGDKGIIDNEGYICIVGRSKDMIISGGLNIYPKEIESVIDDLADIKESAVIGVADADFGEAVIAVVVPQTDAGINETRVLSHLKTQLANFKVPKKIITIKALPRNSMGKVQKNVLRDRYK